MPTPGFPIKMAARLSGLTEHVIRAWERRYAAVSPGRSCTQRRLYSEAEIARLTLLRRATAAGYSIGNIVQLPESEIFRLLPDAPAEASQEPLSDPLPSLPGIPALERAFTAIAALDATELERILHSELVASGRAVMTRDLLVPLIQRIGDAWQNGELRIAHEHVASAVIRTFLGNFVRSHSDSANAPVLVVTTPAGQLHELGAMLAAAAASDHGWRVTYLGPNLPAEEIAGACRQNNARAVALSIVYPGDDPEMATQLRRLRDFLPPGLPILAGGRASRAYQRELESVGAVLCGSDRDFIGELSHARARANPGESEFRAEV